MSQSKELTVRSLTLGNGIPRICVPVVENTAETIRSAAGKVRASAADLMEWRADFYEDVRDHEKTTTLLRDIREELGDMPLLVTYRTKAEGGSAPEEISPEHYEAFNHAVLESGQADMIDVELCMGAEMAGRLIAYAHKRGQYVLLSNHDFQKTPSAAEMRERFERMEAWGADIAKLAVMPQNISDLLSLLTVCREVADDLSRPVVAISMGSIGLESRICGEAFGSAMTFGCLEKASAPGQMDAGQLREILEALHQAH